MSIESLIQRGVAANGGVYVVMVTHSAVERQVRAALSALAGSDSLTGAPMMMHILDF